MRRLLPAAAPFAKGLATAGRGRSRTGGLQTRPYRPSSDVHDLCKSASLADIRAQGYVLTPGRYVGAAEVEEDDEPFELKMARLTKELEGQLTEGEKVNQLIRRNLRNLGYGF